VGVFLFVFICYNVVKVQKIKNMQENTKKINKNINEKEIEVQNFWAENKIFEKSLSSPADSNPVGDFTFFDGPPFATGTPHFGHILAGTIKDVIPRYQTMQGKSVRRVWGWDCHGLPIENLIEKSLNLNSKKEIEQYGVGKFNQAAADSVMVYDKEWKNIVPRLGRWVDMENAYKTMDYTYTESVWWSWKNLYDKGLAFEGAKMMHVCPRCETSLAQSEVNQPGAYQDITDISVTAKFELEEKENELPVYVLAWTTTPWTLPGNSALAVNKNVEYVKVKIQKEGGELEFFIVAKKLVEKVLARKDILEIVDIDINNYIGKKYKQLFPVNFPELFTGPNSENAFKIWHADFITDDAGTGIAHEAPAYGAEDMELANANNIPWVKHVKLNGEFEQVVVDSVLDYANEENKEEKIKILENLKVKKAKDSMSTDVLIIKWLAHSGKLFSKEKIIHSYPHCWRCDTPLLNYATSSWFVDVPKIKDKLIAENNIIGWTPEHVRDGRFGKWLEGAREWAVSRARYWGAPLPVWKSEDGEVKVIGSLEELAKYTKDKYKNNYTVIRHGEAKSNVENYYDEGSDTENHLTEKGVEQVLESCKILKEKNINIIVHSPVLRAVETAKILSENIDILEMETNNNLKEAFEKDLINVVDHVQNRMQNVIDDLEEKYQGKNILLVAHMAPIRGLFKQNGINSVNLENAQIKDLPKGKLPRDEKGDINLHRPYIDDVTLEIEGKTFTRIKDVFDCWYESGSMPYASLHYPFENKELFEKNYPANFISEGMDQTRGWFYSMLNLGVGLNVAGAINKTSPYQNVVVSGMINAADGKKMSKSLKNYTDPMILVEKYGADAMRLALINSPLVKGEAVSFTDTMIDDMYKKVISKVENVLDFYLMYRLEKEDAESGKKSEAFFAAGKDSENVLDIWIINRLDQITNASIDGYENYKLDEAVEGIEKFVDDLSTWYLRRSRDRLKDGDAEALQTMQYVFTEFAKVTAPIMPFLAERIYKNVLADNKNKKESVHLENYPTKKEVSEDVLLGMKSARDITTKGLMMRQKNNIPVRQPLESMMLPDGLVSDVYYNIILEELNVKKVVSVLGDFDLNFELTPELIKEGKQRELSREIKDKRKEFGLIASDFITLTIDESRLELLDDEYKKEMKINSVNIGNGLVIEKI
jgi:isoleucyl-tRNA synthetase